VEGRIHFLGRIPHEEMASCLAGFEVFLLPSLYEGMSHTLLEVMQVGVPIVASALGGNLELLEDRVSGFLIPPRHEQDLAEAVRTLLLDKTLGNRLVDGARHRLADFSWGTTLELTSHVIKEILK
jgi:glycosyltransferase involved in cell wall biosynthesis